MNAFTRNLRVIISHKCPVITRILHAASHCLQLQGTDRWDPFEMNAFALQKRVIYEDLWYFNPRLPTCVKTYDGKEKRKHHGIKTIFGVSSDPPKGQKKSDLSLNPRITWLRPFHVHISSIKMGSGSNMRARRPPLSRVFCFGHAVTSVCGCCVICDSAFCRVETENGEHPCSQNHVQNQPPPGYLGNKIFFPLNHCSSTINYREKIFDKPTVTLFLL